MKDDAALIEEFFGGVRQGDVLAIASACPEPEGSRWVVISQTCDVVRPKIPTITLARVTPPPEDAVGMARDGAMPRFIPLPRLDAESYADMSDVHSYTKVDLLGCKITSGIAGESNDERRSFALAITRWFGRFPFPDNVVPWLRPLESQIRKKYSKHGALGQVLREDVVEIRVEADWVAEPVNLTLHVIVRAGVLPSVDGASGTLNPDFVNSLQDGTGEVKKPSEIAEVLTRTSDPLERSEAFEALAESLASICQPAGSDSRDPAVRSAVAGVKGQLWSDDEFPLSRFRKSEALDLDYLS